MSGRFPLHTGLVGLAHDGRRVLDAVARCDAIDIVAVAGMKLESWAGSEKVATYQDPRSLAVEEDLDLALVAAPLHVCLDTLEACARKHIPVWRWPPPGRSVEETARIVRAFRDHQCPLMLGERWPIAAVSETLDRAAGALQPPMLWTINCRAPDPRHETWMGDLERAGGGSILHLAYDAVRLIARHLGVPQTVSCELGRLLAADQPATYDTEDHAAVTLAFVDGSIATIVTSRTHPAEFWSCSIHAGGGTLTGCTDRCVLTTHDDATLETAIPPFADRLVESIGLAARGIAEHRPPAFDEAELIAAQSIIDASYLSARTGDAESPQRFLDLVAE